jgi:hypothetical protein
MALYSARLQAGLHPRCAGEDLIAGVVLLWARLVAECILADELLLGGHDVEVVVDNVMFILPIASQSLSH